MSTFSGNGKVLDGDDLIKESEYVIHEENVFSKTGSMERGAYPLPTRKNRTLQLSEPMPVDGCRLTLVMEDGRKLDFFVESANVVRPTGEIYE